ncbi:Small, acid-soluble spore protein Tlp [Caprobacter fermentans]|uniref:Protein Tlp homolog n=1 Tax=Caproicibacter fermentans TaxID=2576756 RepID=A0A6N8HWD1_9FIRM|nr:small acid-soluble spore protein Tlp [Caproicibacter fermentans]MVB09968.1 Small, acid-soluble spore protein Tlp [Caproicibacter fermentans]OCN00250.1 small acid-soluble spore protein Tlp [Clostridium sp. W14A]QNK42086.1 small acid-soluble spore protein Tlp [Caproicibacter fermentans]
MKAKPDDRSDNVERIQENINHTIENMRKADEMMEETPDKGTRETLREKNDRRAKALEGLRSEIRDEAKARGKG